MRLDMHAHLMPATLPDWTARFGYGGFLEVQQTLPNGNLRLGLDGRFFREVEPNCYDPDVVVAELDRTRVRAMLLCTVPVLFAYHAQPQHGLEVARFLNDHLAQAIAPHPRRLLGLGTLPMQDARLAARELERCTRQLGLLGVQIGSNINQKHLSEPEFEPFWEAAEALEAPVFVHPWQMFGQEHLTRWWLPWLVGMPAETARAIVSLTLGGVLERHPRLRLCFAHGGGAFPFILGRIRHGFTVRPDLVALDTQTPPDAFLGRFWVDSHTCDPQSLQYVLDVLGPDRVCFGSDYPFPLGEWQNGRYAPGMVLDQMTHLPPHVLQGLNALNALDWLGLPHSYFDEA